MLISRSIAASVAEAVVTTFDGQHPCPMCSVIADGKQTERQSEQSFDLLKKVGDLKFLELATAVSVHASVGNPCVWPVSLFYVLTRTEAPPTPPPLS